MVVIASSARRHGIPDDDIRHAWRNAIRLAEIEYEGESRLLAVGPGRDGMLLELVAVPARGPDRIIHADRLRPKYYASLER